MMIDRPRINADVAAGPRYSKRVHESEPEIHHKGHEKTAKDTQNFCAFCPFCDFVVNPLPDLFPLFRRSARIHSICGQSIPKSGGLRMKSDSVALGIEDDGPEAVLADLVFLQEHLAAVILNGRECRIETAIHVQVDQWSRLGRHVVIILTGFEETSRHARVRVREQAELKAGKCLQRHLRIEDGGVEFDSTVEFQGWNIDPYELIMHKTSDRGLTENARS